jgi:hypothetical protein
MDLVQKIEITVGKIQVTCLAAMSFSGKKNLFNHTESHLENVLLYHKIINFIKCSLNAFYDSNKQ